MPSFTVEEEVLVVEKLLRSSQVRFGPPVAGALVAIAATFVLCSFGAAFGAAAQSPSSGLAVLSGAWMVLTPLVSLFLGAAIAAALGRRSRAYLSALLVWSICVAYAALLLAASAGFRAQAAFLQGSVPGLSGLAAALGLVGALMGAPMGRAIAGRWIAIGAAGRRGIGKEGAPGPEEARETGGPATPGEPLPRPAAPGGEQPSLRH